jgi:hypothetical protein
MGSSPGAATRTVSGLCVRRPVGLTSRTVRQVTGCVKAGARDSGHRTAVHRMFFQEALSPDRSEAMLDSLCRPTERPDGRGQAKKPAARPCLRNLWFRFRHPWPSSPNRGPNRRSRRRALRLALDHAQLGAEQLPLSDRVRVSGSSATTARKASRSSRDRWAGTARPIEVAAAGNRVPTWMAAGVIQCVATRARRRCRHRRARRRCRHRRERPPTTTPRRPQRVAPGGGCATSGSDRLDRLDR